MYSLSVITSIFSEMEWDCSTKEDMLDSSLGLTENIIMSYLGLTEDKTTELLCIQAFLKSKVITKQAAMSCFFSQQMNYSKNASFLRSQDTDRNNPKDLAKFLLSQNSDQLQQQISFQPAVNTWGSYVKSVIFCGWRLKSNLGSLFDWSPQCGLWGWWGTSHRWGRMANFTGRASQENIKTGWWN